MTRRGVLRLPAHTGTTAHVASLYPFVAEAGLGARGIYLGTNVLTGGGGFAFDPFEAYQTGLVTNPNLLIAGEPGMGKSSAVKTFLYRSLGIYGTRRDGAGGRWVAIADPKGEYLPLAERLGLDIITLHPGGTTRLNPLDSGPDLNVTPDEAARRHTDLVGALVAAVLRRDLTPLEDATLGWTITHLDTRRTRRAPTLVDVARLLRTPTDEIAQRARLTPDDLARSVEAATYGLGKLLDRSLRGMFDGPTTVTIDWEGPGIVLDLSVVHHDDDALRLVLLATTAWLQAVLARRDGTQRIQVLDEAWRLLSSQRTTQYLQACWKLCRDYGVANIAVVHRISDLRSQADDGTSTAKVAFGLLADTQTRILFRQASDQIPEARTLLGLNRNEAELLAQLVRGRALWKIAGHAAVVQHHIAPSERGFCDTDTRMRSANVREEKVG